MQRVYLGTDFRKCRQRSEEVRQGREGAVIILITLGFLLLLLPPSRSALLSLPGEPRCPKASFTWSGSLSFIGLTLPWGHLAEGFQVREI